jgi:hypothetical protein
MPPRNVGKAGRRYSVVALATEYRKFPVFGRKWDHLDLMTCEVGRRNVDDDEA